jgi:hypothetical protein
MQRRALTVLRFPAPARAPVSDGPLGRLIVHRGPLQSGIGSLRRLIDELPVGECLAYAIQLNGSPMRRLRAIAAFRSGRRLIERTMRDAGAEVVGRFGVDPDLDSPSCLYELDSRAAEYADRCLRPRGRALPLRRLIERVAGCDPALGAVLIVGRKR